MLRAVPRLEAIDGVIVSESSVQLEILQTGKAKAGEAKNAKTHFANYSVSAMGA